MIKLVFKLPVVLVILFALIMIVVDVLGLGYKAEYPWAILLSAVFLITGFLILAIGGYMFRKAKTTVNPMYPERATQLVTSGIFAFSRNPMYIGFLMWLIACMIFIGNIINILLLPLYIYLANKLYIVPEEKALETIFANEFREYKSKVRRWL